MAHPLIGANIAALARVFRGGGGARDKVSGGLGHRIARRGCTGPVPAGAQR